MVDEGWPFGIALRWEVPNHLMLLVGETRWW